MGSNKYELDVAKINKVVEIMEAEFDRDSGQLVMPDFYLMATILVASETNK